jgi:taurine dioxygenase
MMIDIIPLTDSMGAEVRGVDLSQAITPDVGSLLQDAWHEHVLLLFRDQTLSDNDLKASTGWLGAMSEITMPTDRRGDDDLSIALVSNILDEAGQPIGALGDGEMWFHHDNSFTPAPDKATFLYAVELPSQGGNTLFGNCYRAYEALPDTLRQQISGRRVLQVYDYTVREKPELSDLGNVPHCWQPAVVQHPVTGRCALYVDRLMSAAIEGLPADESDALLDQLFPHMEHADYEHVWRLGDYVIWDNRCSVHARTDFPANERRLLKRGKVTGEPLIAAATS